MALGLECMALYLTLFLSAAHHCLAIASSTRHCDVITASRRCTTTTSLQSLHAITALSAHHRTSSHHVTVRRTVRFGTTAPASAPVSSQCVRISDEVCESHSAASCSGSHWISGSLSDLGRITAGSCRELRISVLLDFCGIAGFCLT